MSTKPKTYERKHTMPRSLTLNQYRLVKTLDDMGDKAYLNEIFREVNKGRAKLIDLGAIHIVLNRLRLSGVLSTREITTDDFPDGRTRRLLIYSLSKQGRQVFENTKDVIREMGVE